MRHPLCLAAVLLIAGVALTACPNGFAANLLTNPGFEDPPDKTMNVDTTVTGWNLLLDTGRAQFYNHTPGALPTNMGGSWSLWLKSFEAAGGGATQTVPVTAGTTYNFTALMLFEPSYPNIPNIDSFVQMQFQDSGGHAVGSADVTHINKATVVADKTTWTPYSVVGTAPAGASQVQVEVGWANGSGVTGQQSAFADDASLTVPEPASLCLFSLCAAGLLVRRRNGGLA